MKKGIISLLLLMFVTSCGAPAEKQEVSLGNEAVENKTYTVGGKDYSHVNIYGNVLSDNTKILVSHINGVVDDLHCEIGAKVKPTTLIAKIVPDPSDIMYKNNSIQIASLSEQIANHQSIQQSTLQNFTTQKNQLRLKEEDLQTKLSTLENNLSILKNQKNISGNDLSVKIDSINDQIENLETSRTLMVQNKEKTLKDIQDGLKNLEGQISNTGNKSLKRLDEIFGVSKLNSSKNDAYELYLGAEDTVLKSDVKVKIGKYIHTKTGKVEFNTTKNASKEIDDLSNLLKDSALSIQKSIPSIGSLNQKQIDAMYAEILAYSDGLLKYKMNFDKLKNSTETTALTFDAKIKEIDRNIEKLKSSKENLSDNTVKSTDLTYDSNINNLVSKIDAIKNGLETIKEQYRSLEDSENTTKKQLDSQITTLQDSISKTSVLLSPEKVYAGISGIVKEVRMDEGNFITVGKPLCVIVPKNDSLKLEIYSPKALEVGLPFNYFKNGEKIGEGSITSESPVINAKTQNYTYKGTMDFSQFKAGDYIDIKVIKKGASDEIWIPLNYVFPKLDGYYVNKKNEESTEQVKVEIGKMNNGEIRILSGLKNGDILSE